MPVIKRYVTAKDLPADCRLLCGDCLEVLPTLPDCSVDAVVTDPPYHLTGASRNGSPRVRGNGPAGRFRVGERGFMGQTWDGGDVAFRPETWAAVARVMRPGAWLLSFGGTRTFHRIACAIEDAGFVLTDTLCWMHGQGFPKAKSCLKPAWEPVILARKPSRGVPPLQIDACRISMNDADREAARVPQALGGTGKVVNLANGVGRNGDVFDPHTAGRWPANLCLSHHEECDGECHPDCPVRLLDEQSGERRTGAGNKRNTKPNTFRACIRHRGEHPDYSAETGGASRFFANFPAENDVLCDAKAIMEAWLSENATIAAGTSTLSSARAASVLEAVVTWAAQGGIQLSGCQGLSTSVTRSELKRLCESAIALTLYSERNAWRAVTPDAPTLIRTLASGAAALTLTGTTTTTIRPPTSDGSAVVATFKATPTNTAAGEAASPSRFIYCAKASRKDRGAGNSHPTVKNTELMRWLCRLVTPPGGTVLDPFAGSGSTGVACVAEGFDFVGVEKDAAYFEIACRRLRNGR